MEGDDNYAFLVMVVLKTIQEKIQEKIESNHPSDPFDLKGLDRTKEVWATTYSHWII